MDGSCSGIIAEGFKGSQILDFYFQNIVWVTAGVKNKTLYNIRLFLLEKHHCCAIIHSFIHSFTQKLSSIKYPAATGSQKLKTQPLKSTFGRVGPPQGADGPAPWGQMSPGVCSTVGLGGGR